MWSLNIVSPAAIVTVENGLFRICNHTDRKRTFSNTELFNLEPYVDESDSCELNYTKTNNELDKELYENLKNIRTNQCRGKARSYKDVL